LSRWCREDGRHSYKVSRPGFGRPRVLHDIVKRRFVRTPWLECGPRLFRQSAGCASMALVCRGETLNLPHMMGLPNRTPGQISRSWSFCANSIKRNPAQDLA
jgi:hypothetical protein